MAEQKKYFGGKDTPYNSEEFVNFYETLQKLQNIDFKTRKGLEDYVSIVNDSKAREKSRERLEIERKAIVEGGFQDMYDYVIANSQKIVEDADESLLQQLALSYMPTNFAANDQYKKVVDAANKAREIERTIKENPVGYLEKELESIPEEFRDYFIPRRMNLLQVIQEEAARNMSFEIEKYGVKRFVSDTITGLDKLSKEAEEEMRKYEEDLSADLNKLRREKNKAVLTQEEEAEVLEKYAEREKQIQEKYKDIGMLKNYVSQLMDIAYVSIKEKK